MLIIYTDGGCRNNQSADKSKVVGGWGVVLKYVKEGKVIARKELNGGKCGFTTNNEMELTAILEALKAVKNYNIPTEIYVDSQYSMDCFTKYINNWRRNGWKASTGKPIKNLTLIQEIDSYLTLFNSIKFVKVLGHSTDVENQRVDALANEAMDKASRCKVAQWGNCE